jgi:hypothetical protein
VLRLAEYAEVHFRPRDHCAEQRINDRPVHHPLAQYSRVYAKECLDNHPLRMKIDRVIVTRATCGKYIIPLKEMISALPQPLANARVISHKLVRHKQGLDNVGHTIWRQIRIYEFQHPCDSHSAR